MPKITVNVRAPTSPRDYGGFPPHVYGDFGKFARIPVFHVSFPDLDHNDLAELSVYVSAMSYLSHKLHYPQHLTNSLSALSCAMRDVSTKHNTEE